MVKTENFTNKQDVDVLIVTVTIPEFEAVVRVFKPKLGNEFRKGHKTYYDLGLVGGARVVMVRSEMGASGPSGSQATIQKAVYDLTPKTIIMVGIAFGSNPEKQRIGDILISQKLQDYELQRVSTDSAGLRKVIPRGTKAEVFPRILDRFRDGETSWRKKAKLEFGLLLTGQKLIDNVDFKQSILDDWPEAIGGEMEGVGLYSVGLSEKIDWIVVKAICDWADGNKSQNKKENQRLAAQNAAEFTFHVLNRGGFAKAVENQIEEGKYNISVERIREVLAACYRRAIFTRYHAQLDYQAMFNSLKECRIVLQKIVVFIEPEGLQQLVAGIIGELDLIERCEKKSNTSDSLDMIDTINGAKLQIINALVELSKKAELSFNFPASLTEEVFFSMEEADKPPEGPPTVSLS